MKVYSPADMAAMLQLKPATLRKYSALLEKYGYEIGRNSQGHRYYQDKDVIALRNIIAGHNSGVTLEESVYNVVSIEKGSSVTNDTNSGEVANGSDTAELKELIHKQSELIGELSNRLDKQIKHFNQQQEYINKRLEERDQALMQTLSESMESQKQIAAAADQEKKGLLARLFKK